MIKVKRKGDFNRTKKYLGKALVAYDKAKLEKIAEKNLHILKEATPSNTGTLANQWGYQIVKTDNGYGILYTNTDIQNGYNIAILVDRGHATRTGTWVSGKNYIDPAIRKTYEAIIKQTWEERNK